MTYNAPALTLVGKAQNLVLFGSLLNEEKPGTGQLCTVEEPIDYNIRDESEW